MLDTARIALVHAKDCTLEGHKPVWEPLGEGDIDWQGQIDALARDGYERIHPSGNLLAGHQGLRAESKANGRVVSRDPAHLSRDCKERYSNRRSPARRINAHSYVTS